MAHTGPAKDWYRQKKHTRNRQFFCLDKGAFSFRLIGHPFCAVRLSKLFNLKPVGSVHLPGVLFAFSVWCCCMFGPVNPSQNALFGSITRKIHRADQSTIAGATRRRAKNKPFLSYEDFFFKWRLSFCFCSFEQRILILWFCRILQQINLKLP